MPHAKYRIVLAVTLAEQGGVQEFLLLFAKYLQTKKHDVTIIAGEGSWLFDACQKAGIATHRLHHMRRAIHPWHDLLAVFELTRYFQTNMPDAVHLNSSKMGAIGSLAARLAHVPRIVYRIGGWVFLEPLSTIMRSTYKIIERISARWKDAIICVHPEDTEIAKYYSIIPRQHIVTIPNGVDLDVFEKHLLSRQEARATLNINEDTFVFGTIANFFPAKDLPHYLNACKKIHKAYPRARFLIIGEGVERNAIEARRSELTLDNIVSLVGQKEHASQYLRAFDAFVLPSAKEGMSWSLLEAMAARIPCIATNVGANAWLLDKDAGWIVPPHDTRALENAMQTVMTERHEAQIRAGLAHERIRRDFPLEQTFARNKETLFPPN